MEIYCRFHKLQKQDKKKKKLRIMKRFHSFHIENEISSDACILCTIQILNYLSDEIVL